MTQSLTPSLLKHVNMPDLLDRVDNDCELLQELFQLFMVEFPRIKSELQDAVSRKNLGETADSAHMLKGMLANLSFEEAAKTMEELEHKAAIADQPGMDRAMAVFNSQTASLLPSLDTWLAEQSA
jgi:HPt (histidine-containing phosphotransfer) domain-containing protein